MRLCVFEDGKSANLYPLTYLRPVFELRCGHTSLLAKIQRKFGGADPSFFVRDPLVPLCRKKYPSAAVNDFAALRSDDLMLVNGRWLVTAGSAEIGVTEKVGVSGGDVVYSRVTKKTIAACRAHDLASLLAELREKLPVQETTEKMINYPWDLVKYNGEAVADDFKLLSRTGVLGKFSSQAAIWGDKDKVYVAAGAEIQPFVVLDSSNGPIIIDEDVIVYPFSRIEGPSSIGKGTRIYGANVREGCSFGPVCRVGGEVEESIIHGYSNKFHEGFLGHSYLGEWVNLGALTTNSDLKNNYGSVQVFVNGEPVDTGETKVGCFIGDHTKTSIGSFINTGSVIGIMSNVVGTGGLLPKAIPSFCWFLNGKAYKGEGLRRMIETARTVASRRKRTLSDEEVELLKQLYELTREEREAMIKKGQM